MAKAYSTIRCTVCALKTSNNGLAKVAHQKLHVRAGEATLIENRYKITDAGWSKAKETITQLDTLAKQFAVAAAHLDHTPADSPLWLDAFDAYSTADTAYRGYVNK